MTRDIRNDRTEKAIADGLLKVLKKKRFADISVSEVARAAQVSRSTFYAHFSGLDEVFSFSVRTLLERTRTLNAQLRCASCESPAPGVPFCVQIRENTPFRPLIEDPQFLPTYLEIMRTEEADIVAKELAAAGVEPLVIDAIIRFQMSGCYAVSTSLRDNENWGQVQAALDTFIRGGLNALRTRAQALQSVVGSCAQGNDKEVTKGDKADNKGTANSRR